MLYEIRNYHLKPGTLVDYSAWVRDHAMSHFRRHLDVVGFWVASGDEPELRGTVQDELGAADVTWIIRWQDLTQRNTQLPRFLAGDEWQEIFARLPGGRAIFQRLESRFCDSLLD